ncbi:unnamed protein product, partial [Mesorhabditis belari]|uniref:Uncharacterized protein n=1 Tax=Mesorhabditis belari TaxID=2138241 RepID=A0AAF3EZ11_9BILA
MEHRPALVGFICLLVIGLSSAHILPSNHADGTPDLKYSAVKNSTLNEKLNNDEYQTPIESPESVDVKLAVPHKQEINRPDIRLLARLAVAMVQEQLYQGTPYEKEGIFQNRNPNHVDMPFPKMKELNEVIKQRKQAVDHQNKNVGKLKPEQEGPPQVPSGVLSPDAFF